MQEALVYAAALALFSFVIVATARMQHEMLILVCIPPVFVALVTGFIMAVYAWDSFGTAVVVPALLLPVPVAWRLGRLYSSRDLLIAIYLAWALAMVLALVAFGFPDAEG
jgi:hypothetical protein